MNHFKRLSWPILIGSLCALIAGIVNPAAVGALVFKLLMFCPSVVVVHMLRKTLFHYIDLEELVGAADNDRTTAATILGVFLFYVVLIYALTQTI